MARTKNSRQKPQPERWLVSAQEVLLQPVRPVAFQSEAAETAWWTARAAEVSLTLAQWDAWCDAGALVAPAQTDR